jgi:hypothetical protein
VFEFEFIRHLARTGHSNISNGHQMRFRNQTPQVFGVPLSHLSYSQHANAQLTHRKSSGKILAL